jgi:hypothetical protein
MSLDWKGDLIAEAYWTWDARIVGMGSTPAQDKHLTVVRGLRVPTRLHLLFPVDVAYEKMTEYNKTLTDPHSLPVLAMTRIQCDIQIKADKDDTDT